MIFKNLWVWFVISLLCHKKVKQLLPLEHPNMIEYFQICVLSTFCSLQGLDKIENCFRDIDRCRDVVGGTSREKKLLKPALFIFQMSSAASLQSRSKPANFREASNLRRKSWKYKFSDVILTPNNVTYRTCNPLKISQNCTLWYYLPINVACNWI